MTVNNVTGDGTMRLDLKSSGTGISDAAGNAIASGFTSGQTYTIEDTPPPVISNALAGQTTTDEATISPFSGVTISDPNSGQTETVTVTLSNHLNGTLSSSAAAASTAAPASTASPAPPAR